MSAETFNVATYFVDRHVAEGRGERTALITDGGSWSYARLAELINRVGHVLRELGVLPEQRVLLALSDGPEFVATWYATLKIGAVTAEAYTFLQTKDYEYYLDYTRAVAAIVDGNTLERLREAGRAARLLVVGVPGDQLRPGETSFEAAVARAPVQLDPAPTDRDGIAIWKFTTGSTGRPKACVHRMVTPLESFERYARGVLEMQPDDAVLPIPKLFFGYARDMAALFPFGVGAAGIVFGERTTPELVFELIERHRPTILVQVPTMIRAMLDHPGAADRDLSCLRLCTSAGEALPRELYDEWRATFGVEVLDGIGSSEAYHIFISNRLGSVRPGTAGQTVPGYRARVVDEQGHSVPDGELGRLWIEAPTAALMYWEDRDASVRTYAGDTVTSGDLFVRDGDGYFTFQGRADELLKVSGVWVAPFEVERALLEHPDVVECAVVGVERDGLTVTRAHVVLRTGLDGSAALAQALKEFARGRLSPHKYPREIEFAAELPKTGSGKVDRRALRSAGG
ncbi:MAG TPA: benzoate-CoA ligase family protein [Solirubrobacteraceae bacterium]|nr:benzoate-CoA ligase family protein [Solirubrobacteraceae bacterium]